MSVTGNMKLAKSSRTGLPDAASGGARRWHNYEEVEGDPTLTGELRDVLTATRDGSPIPTHELEMRLAEFKSQVNSAEHGQLSAAGWKYVNRDPRLWEFRLLWGDQDIKVRAYFHEPRQRTDQTVVLLFHVKDTSLPTSEAIASAQNSFIERARCRLTTGQGNDWGLNWTRPFLGGG